MATKLLGKTIFLDPGHQGPHHGEDLSRQVDNGRGGTKDCQTTGMVTVNGIPEHTINWNVAQLVKSSLESLGARVVLSRADDSGWGGCVDDRARAANASGAAVAVSIHADSAPAEASGFHLIVPQLPIPDPAVEQAQSAAGRAASQLVRDAYLHAGFQPADYAGVQEGLQTRADVAGPALSTVPTVFVEMGNGANPEDAALLESEAGQLRHAIAITTGLSSYLLGVPPGGTGSAESAPAAAVLAQPIPAATAPDASPSPIPGTPPAQPELPAAPGTPNQTRPGVQGQDAATPNMQGQGQYSTTPGTQNSASAGTQDQNSASEGVQGHAQSSTPPVQSQSSPSAGTQSDNQSSASLGAQGQNATSAGTQGQAFASPGAQDQNSTPPGVHGQSRNATSPTMHGQNPSQNSPSVGVQAENSTPPGVHGQGQNATSPGVPGQGQGLVSPSVPGQGQGLTSPGTQGQEQGLTRPDVQGQGQTAATPGTQGQSQNSVSPGGQTQNQNLRPNQQSTPGCATTAGAVKVPGCPDSGTQQQTKPETEKLDSSTLVNAGMQLLLPLIRSFGMDNSAITSELINLAYTLASTLLGPAE
ncbi:N-acetylmuramoyl-L-alanine amidase [Nocardia goodfellowii]|uniref:N-acetylmuramoyl-L-alanine amidase n=1 Tax=Nocardia goodfellowii TaxID=882446 RepID=A0ABS4QFD3_9NOCA|nr:N-acetylmuramoyl-L-alanine amidase [Nocardia goodfellowii]